MYLNHRLQTSAAPPSALGSGRRRPPPSPTLGSSPQSPLRPRSEIWSPIICLHICCSKYTKCAPKPPKNGSQFLKSAEKSSKEACLSPFGPKEADVKRTFLILDLLGGSQDDQNWSPIAPGMLQKTPGKASKSKKHVFRRHYLEKIDVEHTFEQLLTEVWCFFCWK